MMCYSLALVKSPCVYLFVVGLGVVCSCAARVRVAGWPRDPSVYSARRQAHLRRPVPMPDCRFHLLTSLYYIFRIRDYCSWLRKP